MCVLCVCALLNLRRLLFQVSVQVGRGGSGRDGGGGGGGGRIGGGEKGRDPQRRALGPS